MDGEQSLVSIVLTCEGCWTAIEASDDVILASLSEDAQPTGELRVFERGEYVYFHDRCWREDNEVGWVERQRGKYVDIARERD